MKKKNKPKVRYTRAYEDLLQEEDERVLKELMKCAKLAEKPLTKESFEEASKKTN